MSRKTKTQHFKIDDSVIAKGDPNQTIDPVHWGVSIYEGKEQYENDLKTFSRPQRLVFAVIWYMDEVNNGGHDQFYFNSTGIVWEDAIDGFEMIGLPEAKKIIEESARRFDPSPSFDRFERQDALDKIEQGFDDLDTRFYELDNKINITDRIADYILANKEAFYFDGDFEVLAE